VAYDKQVLVASALEEKLLKVAEGSFGGEGIREQDLRFIPGFCADERCGLETALEGA
jgi:hypothetical protein